MKKMLLAKIIIHPSNLRTGISACSPSGEVCFLFIYLLFVL